MSIINNPIATNKTFLKELDAAGRPKDPQKVKYENELHVLQNIREELLLGMSQAHRDSVQLSNQIKYLNLPPYTPSEPSTSTGILA